MELWQRMASERDVGRERKEKGVNMLEWAVLGGRGARAWSQVWYYCVHSVSPWAGPKGNV